MLIVFMLPNHQNIFLLIAFRRIDFSKWPQFEYLSKRYRFSDLFSIISILLVLPIFLKHLFIARPFSKFQVILCGEYGVGKTSLFRRLSSNVFVKATDRASTLGLDHFGKIYKVGTEDNVGKEIKLQLWDTGGMERVASITSSYYKYSEAAILVFALDNPDSFHILSQHLLDIVTYAENAKIFL